MSHPLVTIHSHDWIELLEYLKQTIYFLAREEDGKTEEEASKFIEIYVKQIEDNRETIFLATAYGIVKYLNFYNVMPSEGVHDEFKGIYFTGMAVSEHLNNLELTDLNKLHLRAMLRLLDFRLAYPHKVNRKLLTSRIKSVIKNNSLDKHLGLYGWYITYKCLFNSANEKSKTI